MPELSRKIVIERSVLADVAEARLEDAKILREARRYAGAIYLATYAVECWLKIAVCHALDWNEMRATFTTHDLELLFVHSGLERRMKRNTTVYTSFRKIQDLLTRKGAPSIRYRASSKLGKADADTFLDWVDGNDGVVTWVRKQV